MDAAARIMQNKPADTEINGSREGGGGGGGRRAAGEQDRQDHQDHPGSSGILRILKIIEIHRAANTPAGQPNISYM